MRSELGSAEKTEELRRQVGLLALGQGSRSWCDLLLNCLLTDENGSIWSIDLTVVIHRLLLHWLLNWLRHWERHVRHVGHILHSRMLDGNGHADHCRLQVGGLRHLRSLLLENRVLRGVNL